MKQQKRHEQHPKYHFDILSMKRGLFVKGLYKAVLSFFLFVFLAFPVRAEEKILLFSSAAAVKSDSSLEVRENITVAVEGKSIRRGIFRDFPTIYKGASGRTVRVDFWVKEALLNGNEVPYRTEPRSNGVRIYLGDPDKLAPLGTQTYSLSYVTTGQIGFWGEYDELYWNVTGNDWAFPIEKVIFSVTLPEKVSFLSVDIYTGFQGERGKDARLLPDGSVETTRRLLPNEGLTVAYSWAKGVVFPPKQPLRYTFFDKFGIWFFLVTPLLLLTYYVIVWRRWGKDPLRKPVIPLFYPPEELGPGFLRYVKQMGMDNVCFTAEILNLAVKGFIVIEELTLEEAMERLRQVGENGVLKGIVALSSKLAGRRYSLRLVKERALFENFSSEEKILLSSLFGNGREELLLRQSNYKILEEARERLEQYYRQSAKPLFSKNTLLWAGGFFIPLSFFLLLRWGGQIQLAAFLMGGTGALMVIGSVILSAWRGFHRKRRFIPQIITIIMLSLFFSSLAGSFLFTLSSAKKSMLLLPLAIAAIALVFRKLITVRTERGNDILGVAEGLAMYINTAERHRLEMFNPPEETPEVFERLLPYAFALDGAKTWANRFNELLRKKEYHSTWYVGKDASIFYTGEGISDITSSVANSIASSSVVPGSSSGRGGGGFAGGGGGGGGGGGW
ncbi:MULTISPECIES: DUF2207 domain-containing protein [Aminobacterium]|uniref:DUF2207 domain-containing protein n=2 Tax=Aminobacterium TaxID=81466 RepID=UPI002579C5CC|nr:MULTISPECIES: DUF2207 domain-containing protein [unclassified Aminobacterium]